MRRVGLDREKQEPQGVPITLTNAAVWAITTAMLGWAGNRLYEFALEMKGATSAQSEATLIDRGRLDKLEIRVQSLEEWARNHPLR